VRGSPAAPSALSPSLATLAPNSLYAALTTTSWVLRYALLRCRLQFVLMVPVTFLFTQNGVANIGCSPINANLWSGFWIPFPCSCFLSFRQVLLYFLLPWKWSSTLIWWLWYLNVHRDRIHLSFLLVRVSRLCDRPASTIVRYLGSQIKNVVQPSSLWTPRKNKPLCLEIFHSLDAGPLVLKVWSSYAVDRIPAHSDFERDGPSKLDRLKECLENVPINLQKKTHKAYRITDISFESIWGRRAFKAYRSSSDAIFIPDGEHAMQHDTVHVTHFQVRVNLSVHQCIATTEYLSIFKSRINLKV